MEANNQKRLVRNANNRMIAGVCGGLADFFGLDATLVRIVTLILVLFGGLSLWVYILLWLIVPGGNKGING